MPIQASSIQKGMYMKRQCAGILILMFSCALVFCFLSGCSQAKMTERYAAPVGEEADRKIAQSAQLRLQVVSLDTAQQSVTRIVTEAGGRIQKSAANQNEKITLECRVPAAALQSTLDAIGALGEMQSWTAASDDITDSWTDLEARLKNSIALRDRLRALLDKAANVTEAVAGETELARVQGDIESMQARLNSMKSSVEMASVTVELEPKRLLGPIGLVAYGFGWLVKKLFVLR